MLQSNLTICPNDILISPADMCVPSSIVRLMVTYRATTCSPKVAQVTIGNTLNKLQQLACVYITDTMRTCPTAALKIILHRPHDPTHRSGVAGNDWMVGRYSFEKNFLTKLTNKGE